jgi:hypothetical protein
MPGVVTTRFRYNIVDQFVEQFGEASATNMYLFVSRVEGFPDDLNPPTPVDTIQDNDYEAWRNMIALKKITSGDAKEAIVRHNWTSGTVYHEYQTNDSNLYANTFYAMTTDYNVYKCLFNNNGATSTVQPTGTSTDIVKTSDGYMWKYMYTIDSADVTKFVTTTFIPVQNASSVVSAAVNGAIDVVDMNANGTGYRSNTGTFATVTDGSTFTLQATASATDDFYNNGTIYIQSGKGAGQLREITDYTGSTRTPTINVAFNPVPNTSSTYWVGPKIEVLGDGNQAFLAYANNVAGGQIRTIEVIASGNNYSYANVVITGAGGAGSGATANAYIAPYGGHGYHPARELGATSVILSTQLSGNVSNTFVTNNDFRILGLVSNPTLRSSGSVATGQQYDQSYKLTLTSVSGDFQADEIIVSNRNATGRVIRFANSNAARTAGDLLLQSVRPNPNGNFFLATETITGNVTSVTATISSVTEQALVPYTGEIIYRENRQPVTRTADQTEDIKLVIKF